jgi:hypothetical protein
MKSRTPRPRQSHWARWSHLRSDSVHDIMDAGRSRRVGGPLGVRMQATLSDVPQGLLRAGVGLLTCCVHAAIPWVRSIIPQHRKSLAIAPHAHRSQARSTAPHTALQRCYANAYRCLCCKGKLHYRAGAIAPSYSVQGPGRAATCTAAYQHQAGL